MWWRRERPPALSGIELRSLSSSPWLVTIMTEISWFQRGNIEGTKYLLI
jgi:hypothetical protein